MAVPLMDQLQEEMARISIRAAREIAPVEPIHIKRDVFTAAGEGTRRVFPNISELKPMVYCKE